MFRSLFGKSRISPPRPRVPDDLRVYAIGDIHGRADLLDDVLARIDADHAARAPKRRLIIALGDLIDRGPDSAGVVERIMGLAGPDLRVLAGNHEELMLLTLDGDREAARIFARAGGRETILSYGVREEDYERADFGEMVDLMRAHIPQRHIDFVRNLEDVIEVGDYAFVHAGIRPGVPLDQQKPEHLRWIRTGFLDHKHSHPRMIVHGHTITESVDERSNRIGIDTGAYASGVLTAIGLDGEDRWFIATA